MKAFQKRFEPVVDGIAGPQTQTALKQATTPAAELKRPEPDKSAMEAGPILLSSTIAADTAKEAPNAASLRLLDTARPIREIIVHCTATVEGSHAHGESRAVGIVAGLIPCPLTLFVMTFAIIRGVAAAGLVFASTMLLGVVLVLAMVALPTTMFRTGLDRLLRERPRLLQRLSRSLECATGGVLVWAAVLQLTR